MVAAGSLVTPGTEIPDGMLAMGAPCKVKGPLAGTPARVKELLDEIQKNLLERARKFVADNTTRVSSWDEFKEIMGGRRGFLVAGWCGDADCEARIKAETKATVRVIPLEGEARAGSCIRCGRPSATEVYFAQAY